MKKYLGAISVISLGFILTSCAPVQNQSVTYVNPETTKPMTLALEYKDFQKAAISLVQSLLQSPVMQSCGGSNGRCVIAVATIRNDTTQNIDLDQLLSDIKEALLQSGKVYISAAVSTTDRDKMLQEIRKLRGNPEFNAKTLPGKGNLIAPKYLLSGEIIQKTYYVGDRKYVEYYFILRLIDVDTGLVLWEGKKVIAKAGSSDMATW